MARPVNFRQYFTNEYPELDIQHIDIPALLNSVSLSYGDHRDIEYKSVDLDQKPNQPVTARSINRFNILHINQKKLWQALGWATVRAVPTLVDAGDKNIFLTLAALIPLIRDFIGLNVHQFPQSETNVLFAIYHTGTLDDPYFTKSQVIQTYAQKFDKALSESEMQSILDQLVSFNVIFEEGSRYGVAEEINLRH